MPQAPSNVFLRSPFGWLAAMSWVLAAVAPCAEAQDTESPRYRFGLELKANWRDSEAQRFQSPFPFPDDFLPPDQLLLPPAQRHGFLETVDAGSHVEISVVTLRFEANWSPVWAAKVKLDFIDRYDRNPSSAGDDFDVDEAWLRWGREIDGGGAPAEHRAIYAKLGKFGRFERQDDRHLESYGLISTAFNRFEDVGLEMGIDFTRNLYAKVSYTQGNPLFFRDVNALAGDNGIDILNFGSPSFIKNPDPELKTGFPIFYDTDVDFEDVDFENPQLAVGIGWRWGGDRLTSDVMVWGRRRDLAETFEFDGTFYGGDLDLLRGPGNAFSLGISGKDKRELGANLWLYSGPWSVFGQYVDQELAGLARKGFEVELARSFELPLWAAAGGRQLFSWLAPAVRYLEMDNEPFGGSPQYPGISVRWDWTKLDLGFRLGLWENMDLTAEWAAVEFETASGFKDSVDELLVTLRLGIERGWGR
ncbi:MAG: hypothetical protein HC897_20560 [Thermoanaerobaculia bacterium]|nr:hypothetical protein [Thermoanaerobaculia bacterium]